MGDLKILIGEEKGKEAVTVLHLSGDLDASTYKELQDKAAEAVAAGSRNLLLDMSGVSFMGSAGFRAIHAISNLFEEEQSEAMEKSSRVKLFNPSDEVCKVIKTLGFDNYLDIHDDLHAAVDSY